jgi:hypothetical protein
MPTLALQYAQNDAPDRSQVIEIARNFLSRYTAIDPSRYDRSEYLSSGNLLAVDFMKDIPDPPDSPFAGTTAFTPMVFIDPTSLDVIGYTGNNTLFPGTAYVTLANDTIQAVIDFVGARDPQFAGYTPSQYVTLFRLEAIDAGEIYVVEIIRGPKAPEQLYVGGGYRFYVRKKTNEVLGFDMTF